MRLIDLHVDWLLQYAGETVVFEPSLNPDVGARLGQADGYLQATRAAVVSCYRNAADWAAQPDSWAALGQLLARVEAEFPGRLLIGPDDFARWLDDGDGLTWKKGFWTKAQEGWSWVPAQWVKQPQGFAYQDGYWDRTLEDRGTLFAPAQLAANADPANTVYQPVAQVAPESYSRLNGAFGRPNTFYDGYPGVSYDSSGNYYGYAQYGNLGLYSGYLDYPYSNSCMEKKWRLIIKGYTKKRKRQMSMRVGSIGQI